VQDGLKPVHRRVLYAMYDGGYRPDRGYSKCSRIVGDVMGSTTRTATRRSTTRLVRLAQPWSLRYPLVDGNGNFGSPATTRPRRCATPSAAGAARRCRCCATSTRTPSTSGQLRRPAAGAHVLPARFPNLLVNGSAGIAGRHGHEHPAAQPA
jgi:DNA gyrase subunit A